MAFDPTAKLLHVQPFQFLYVLCKVAIVLVKLPLWTLLYVVGIGKPRPSWTLKKTLVVKALREVIETPMRTGDFRGRNHTKEVAPKHCQDARFIWIEKAPSELVTGEIKKLADTCGAESVRIPAYGFGNWGSGTEIPLARDGERIYMHMHGGAFVMGTAHPEDITANIPRGFIQFGQPTFTRALSIDYRLCASHPYPTSTPFPTSLLDALAGYLYLTRTLGFKPENVFIGGDSAGGNLAQSLVRYLRDNPQLGLGLPGGMVLFSPWADPTGTHQGLVGGQGKKNLESDYVTAQTNPKYSMGQYGLRSLIGKIPVKEARQNPYIAPASLEMDPMVMSGMFTGFPPSYVICGGGESLIDEIRTLQKRMKADMHERLVYDEVADAIHDFVALPLWEPERSNTFNSIVKWVQHL